jgi:hypothetical protein
MASPSQITANRANAAQSTGPKSAPGKETASANSLKHGLTAARLILPGEDPEAFNQLRASLASYYGPESEHEQKLVDRLAEADWRLQRVRRHETAFYKRAVADMMKTAPELTHDDAFALLFIDPAAQKQMRLFMRYMGSIERAYKDALAELERVVKVRHRTEQLREELEIHRALSVPLPELGFVSHAPNTPRTNTAFEPYLQSDASL